MKTQNLNDIFSELRDTLTFFNSVDTSEYPYHGYHVTADNLYRLELPVAGLTKSDISIKAVNNTLEIRGGKKDHKWSPPFERTFMLPKNSDTVKIKASVENGLLTVDIPLVKDSATIINII